MTDMRRGAERLKKVENDTANQSESELEIGVYKR